MYIDFFKKIYSNCNVGRINIRPLPNAKQEFIDVSDSEGITSFIQKNADKNLYYGVALRNGGGTKEHITQIPAVWCDCDFKDTPRATLIENYKKFPVKPSAIISSGGGIHFYWFLKTPASKDDIHVVEDLNRRIATVIGGDLNACDASRILRIPGTINRKPGRDNAICEIKDINAALYDLKDFDFLPILTQHTETERPALQQTHAHKGFDYVAALDGIPEGDRDNAIYKYACRLRALNLSFREAEALITLAAEQCKPPFPVNEARKKLDSAWRLPKNSNLLDKQCNKCTKYKHIMASLASFLPTLEDALYNKYGLSECASTEDLQKAVGGDIPITDIFDEIKNSADIQQIKTTITEEITKFVDESQGYFSIKDLCEMLNLRSDSDKSAVRVQMHRLAKKEIIQKHKTRNGIFRKYDKESTAIDFINAVEETTPLYMPFNLSKMVEIMPGNIILVAGSPNSGKTAFLLNIIRYNMKKYEINYFNSEMGASELKKRLKKFDDIMIKDWKFKAWERSENFADAIVPGKESLNIIDFLEIHDNFYEIGGQLREIHDKLKGGIAIVAIQKKPGQDMGKGGVSTLEKPRLALALESGKCKIVKAKNWLVTENPNQKTYSFKLVDGCKFIQVKDWCLEN